MSNGGTAVDNLATILFNEWKRVDPRSNVALHPASYMATFADMARVALGVVVAVPPLDLSQVFFVVHASGHFEFFNNDHDAEDRAYGLGRGYYTYNEKSIGTYGDRLVRYYDEWVKEALECHKCSALSGITVRTAEEVRTEALRGAAELLPPGNTRNEILGLIKKGACHV